MNKKKQKFIVSICWMDSHMEMLCEPFGFFKTEEEAEEFIENKIDEIKEDYIRDYDEEYVEEYLVFSYSVKEID